MIGDPSVREINEFYRKHKTQSAIKIQFCSFASFCVVTDSRRLIGGA